MLGELFRYSPFRSSFLFLSVHTKVTRFENNFLTEKTHKKNYIIEKGFLNIESIKIFSFLKIYFEEDLIDR